MTSKLLFWKNLGRYLLIGFGALLLILIGQNNLSKINFLDQLTPAAAAVTCTPDAIFDCSWFTLPSSGQPGNCACFKCGANGGSQIIVEHQDPAQHRDGCPDVTSSQAAPAAATSSLQCNNCGAGPGSAQRGDGCFCKPGRGDCALSFCDPATNTCGNKTCQGDRGVIEGAAPAACSSTVGACSAASATGGSATTGNNTNNNTAATGPVSANPTQQTGSTTQSTGATTQTTGAISQTSNPSQTQTQTANPIVNVSVQRAQPSVVAAAQPRVVTQVSSQTVTQLPSTGLPALVWALLSLIPLGLKYKKFGSSKNTPNFVWQQKQYQK